MVADPEKFHFICLTVFMRGAIRSRKLLSHSVAGIHYGENENSDTNLMFRSTLAGHLFRLRETALGRHRLAAIVASERRCCLLPRQTIFPHSR